MHRVKAGRQPLERTSGVDREPTPSTDEPIRWPDPSPLDDWWISVMARGKPDTAP